MEILHTNKPLQKGAITLKEKETIQSPILDETLPHQMNFPSFKGTGKKMQQPFINQYDVVIGDSKYDSTNSPLNNWSDEVILPLWLGKNGYILQMISDGFQKKIKNYLKTKLIRKMMLLCILNLELTTKKPFYLT